MNPTTILAVLGGISVAITSFITIIKGFPVLWRYITNTTKVISSIPKIAQYGDINQKVNELDGKITHSNEMHQEIKLLQELVQDVQENISNINDNALKIAIATFQATSTGLGVPSFVIGTSPDKKGLFIWANRAWYNLIGIGPEEAKNNQYWASVAPEDYARVKAASDSASEAKIVLKVSYKLINLKTEKETEVTLTSWPLIQPLMPENSIVYLGVIEVMEEL